MCCPRVSSVSAQAWSVASKKNETVMSLVMVGCWAGGGEGRGYSFCQVLFLRLAVSSSCVMRGVVVGGVGLQSACSSGHHPDVPALSLAGVVGKLHVCVY